MNSKLIVAIKNSLAGKFITYFIQFGALAIYARVFTPEQFGIIASVQVFMIFFQMLADVGIGPAIINQKRYSNKARDGVFTLTFMIGAVLAIGFYLFTYALNYFYDNYSYQDLGKVLGTSIFFYTICTVPLTSFNKDSKFMKIAFYDAVSEVISLILVLVMLYLNFGILALACKNLFQAVSRFTLLYYGATKTSLGRPLIGPDIHLVKDIIGFAAYQFGFNFINYFSRNLDNILVAKFYGVNFLGIYDKAYQLMQYPLLVTTFGLSRAIQPILTKFNSDVEFILKEHNRLTERLLFISVLMSVFIYTNANNIVYTILGAQWESVVPVIKVFCFMIPIQSVLSTSGSFFQVLNATKLLFIAGVISALFNVLAISIGVYMGKLEYIALMLVFSFSINFLISYFILFNYCFN
ncbi:oligosaccharide flippase family protein, partial [Vibrio breoganii]